MDPSESLLSPGKYSDFTVICGCRTRNVYNAVICPPSDFLRHVCEGEGFVEAEQSVINLIEDDPDAADRVLKYLYTQQHCDKEAEKDGRNEGLEEDKLRREEAWHERAQPEEVPGRKNRQCR